LPGPLIEAQEGDTIRITITNKNEIMATTVHWHGLHQRGTVWNDGTSQITQCSLSPFESQTYEFIAYPAGTHYWHSHQGMTATDGIAGPIVIHPKVPEPFYEELNLSVDDVEEQMLFLMDYFDDTSLQREAGLASESLNWIGNPASLLLNGKGLSKYCTNFTGQQPFSKYSCSDTLQWTPSILVEQGKTYRFRVVNGGGLVMQNLAINQHNMTIVEVDGTNVVPYTVQNLTIAPGQRYSVIVYADQGENDDDGEENFWMQSLVAGRPLSNMPEGNWVLSYANSTANVQLPNVNQKKPTHPVYDVDQTQVFTAFFENLHTTGEEEVDNITTTTRGTCQVVWTLNNISFVYPDSGSPLIYSAVEESQRLGWPLPGPLSVAGDSVPGDDDDTTPPGYYIQQQATSVIRLNEGDVAEFVIENSVGIEGTSEFHPWHFHGHSFWVVGRGIGTYNETQDVPNYNLVNPVLRDTTVGLKNSWVAIRFIANNPGVWYLHCHIESHLTMGMGFVVIVSPNKIGSLTDSVQYCSANDLQSPFQSNIVNSSMDDTTTIAAADESEAASAGNNNDAGYNAAAGIIATTMAAVVIVTSMMSYL
ncbi:Cu-oxidase_2-domain-containing protein, partial [Fragilariopsis cylindrus CCMP1102]